MKAHGDSGTAVWAVSFGLTETTWHAALETVDRPRLDWPWLGPMLWAAWSPGDAHGQYALVDADGQPSSVYEALATRASKAGLVAWPGVYPADHPSGEYEGGWRVTPSGADIGGSGDRLTIHFQGTRLDLTVRRGDYRAFLFVTVDGEPANALPRDTEGRAYVVLYDPAGETGSVVTLARDLPAERARGRNRRRPGLGAVGHRRLDRRARGVSPAIVAAGHPGLGGPGRAGCDHLSVLAAAQLAACCL